MLPPIALCFLIGAPVLYGLNGVLLKRASVSVPPFAAMAVSMAVLFLLSASCSLILERDFQWSLRTNSAGFAALLLVGIVNTAAFWCLLNAYKYVAVWQYQMFALLTPVFSAFFAYFILAELFSWRLFVGLAFIGAGLLLALK